MKQFLVLITILTLLLTLGITGCQEELETSSLSPDQSNPKLESRLNQLFQAAQQGDLTSFAQQNTIVLNDGKIRVIIECLPGKIDAVANSAGLLIAIEKRYENLLQVLVSPGNLNKLTEDENVKYVRLPQSIQPATGP